MSNIIRRSPFREIANMQNVMDRIFEETWRPYFGDGELGGLNSLALDVDETDQNYLVTTEMPGVKAENINVKLDGDYLVIEGEIPEQVTEKKDGTRSLMKERRYGHFSRRVRLPQPVNSDKIEAVYRDGVLNLTLPKTEAVKPKMIPIKVGNNQK
jgi:HSP20 family protein